MLTQAVYAIDRSLKTIGIIDAYPKYADLPGFAKTEGNMRCCTYSPCGKWFAWATPENVKVASADTGEIRATLPTEAVHEIGFSPQGSYIITWQRPTKQEDGAASKNLKVWRTETAEPVTAFVQKLQTGWNLQYTYDEKYCARGVTNEVQFYESDKMDKVWGHLRVEGVSDFALGPGKNYSVAAFVPERKGQPAMVKVFQVPNWTTVLSQKSFFKADRVQLKWNDLGTTVLVFAQTDADKTGKSYYGETNLYLMTVAGGSDCRVQLDKEGPIHDVIWSPDSKEFGVVYGFMPAKTTIFDCRANVVHSLPAGPRNTILFSPHARFVIVAGFGNLQGQIDIYDRQAGMRKITTIESSNPSICEWSPDGRHILTATTSPRLRVDNGVMIWHYTGELMYKVDMEELYHVLWRPQPGVHTLPSPLPSAPAPHASALSHVGTATPKKSTGAYRPPHARGSETPLHFKREDEGGAAHNYVNGGGPGGLNGFGNKGRRREVPGATPAERLVPGAAPGGGVSLAGTGAGADEDQGMSKAALKNKKKREAAKKAKAEAEAAGVVETREGGRDGLRVPGGNMRNRSRNGQPNGRGRSKSRGPDGPPKDALAGPKKVQTPPPPPQPATPSIPQISAEDAAQDEKKVRGLHKKLRAIEELKMRLAKGEKLEDTQLKKIKTEDGVRKELEGLGADP
ncbi:eukaryotic translation initiation factor eIF2A-domain-containing protein [Tricharina praecox]|uniref:eukaryotic translation initiation factor eIF2A-domain-containing protein n=1 Tax=Tricharina praecox TaxID=43433 RepID=UPI002220D8A0|nr:eukaryotic translation initiation factor eIF2A-domain-containing protein [Tricharina praecox]KAI5855499.1 eukaryotic translation initiation factor eIF2A-domain-containing protein [Tricharina praecox]